MGVSSVLVLRLTEGLLERRGGWSRTGMPAAGDKRLGNLGWVQNFEGPKGQHDIC